MNLKRVGVELAERMRTGINAGCCDRCNEHLGSIKKTAIP
jgi:hypothetical protein